MISDSGQKGREIAELENYMQSLRSQYNLDRVDEMAEESCSNVDREELLKRIEDEHHFSSKPSSRTSYSKPLLQPLKALPPPSIAKQIEAFHKLKNEVETELELYIDEIDNSCGEDGSKLLKFPHNFEEMVERQTEETK